MNKNGLSSPYSAGCYVTGRITYILYCLLALAALPSVQAQIAINPPVGLKPNQDLEIYTRNGLLVQQKFTFTTADPNASVNNLSCATPVVSITAPAGILKDPNGDSNYLANINCTQQISASFGAYEIVFEDLDTELESDFVIITDAANNVFTFSGNRLPVPFFITTSYFTVRFQANNNATVGRGFRLRWRGVTTPFSTTLTPATAFGNALQFDSKTGALLAGYLTSGQLYRTGQYSVTLGADNLASGNTATAMGFSNVASGSVSTVFGQYNTASSTSSTAFGQGNTASGAYSTALGVNNTASGIYSTALGFGNTASGNFSTAMGSRVSTYGNTGVFTIGIQTR